MYVWFTTNEFFLGRMILDVPACYAGYRQPCIDQAPGAN